MNQSIGHSLPERLYLKSYHKSMRPIIVFSLLRSIVSSTMTDRRQRTSGFRKPRTSPKCPQT
jgi:hypothetical protein